MVNINIVLPKLIWAAGWGHRASGTLIYGRRQAGTGMGAACKAQPPASWAEGVLTLGRHGLQQKQNPRGSVTFTFQINSNVICVCVLCSIPGILTLKATLGCVKCTSLRCPVSDQETGLEGSLMTTEPGGGHTAQPPRPLPHSQSDDHQAQRERVQDTDAQWTRSWRPVVTIMVQPL